MLSMIFASKVLRVFKHLLSNFLWLLVRVLHVTYRYRYLHVDHYLRAAQAHPQHAFVIGLFHCNAVAGLLGHRGLPFSPLISQSSDGDLIAYISAKLGLEPIRGSSSKGAVAAQRQMSRILATGRRPAYTVDGPRGPRFRVKSGVVAIAAQHGLAALPMAALADRYWEFGSWDRFRLPKPFARILICYDEPVFPTSNDPRVLLEDRRRFQSGLLRLEDQGPDVFSHWESALSRLPF